MGCQIQITVKVYIFYFINDCKLKDVCFFYSGAIATQPCIYCGNDKKEVRHLT